MRDFEGADQFDLILTDSKRGLAFGYKNIVIEGDGKIHYEGAPFYADGMREEDYEDAWGYMDSMLIRFFESNKSEYLDE